jgi:hypothetical protein
MGRGPSVDGSEICELRLSRDDLSYLLYVVRREVKRIESYAETLTRSHKTEASTVVLARLARARGLQEAVEKAGEAEER